MKNILKIAANSSWVITLTSTMLGVLIGLYLNDYNTHLNLEKKRVNAFQDVLTEIDNNFVKLAEYHDEIDFSLKELRQVSKLYNTDMKIIIHKDSLNSINQKFRNPLHELPATHQDSLWLVYWFQLSGNLSVMDLHTATWDTYKQTDFLGLTDFNCIATIEDFYNQFEKFNISNTKFREGRSSQINREREKFDDHVDETSMLLFKLRLLKQIEAQRKELIACD
ncbi:MAG: hypothetical protein HOK72_04040 [Flavobacteriales bacterium]|nr:hypothetical protein [Flavobacteriales bacterium]